MTKAIQMKHTRCREQRGAYHVCFKFGEQLREIEQETRIPAEDKEGVLEFLMQTIAEMGVYGTDSSLRR
jgi:hypothetical protein